jgi:hypothetical protein
LKASAKVRKNSKFIQTKLEVKLQSCERMLIIRAHTRYIN